MAGQKRTKVAREIKYRSPALRRDEFPDAGWNNGEQDDGGTGVREPRRPLPPSPVSGAGALPLPESFIEARLPNPPVR